MKRLTIDIAADLHKAIKIKAVEEEKMTDIIRDVLKNQVEAWQRE